MITIEEERTLLERILTSDVIGFVVKNDDGKLIQCIDPDPELRLALSEWKTQRIREMERSQRSKEPVTDYSTMAEIVRMCPLYPFDGSGGQAGDDQAFSQAMSELAWQASNAGRDHSVIATPPAFPGS